MDGIKMSDCKFYVDENARTVVCVIPNTHHMIRNYINDKFIFSDIDLNAYWGRQFRDKMRMPHSFMGKAVCAPEDEWNEELGRMIAFSRAKDKCYKSFFKRANMFVQTVDRRLNEVINTFNDMGEKLNDRKDMLEAKIEHLIQKE